MKQKKGEQPKGIASLIKGNELLVILIAFLLGICIVEKFRSVVMDLFLVFGVGAFLKISMMRMKKW